MTWQPIETAPRDGTDILAGAAYTDILGKRAFLWVACGYFCEAGDWVFYGFDIEADEYSSPTHWMPFPEPPQ